MYRQQQYNYVATVHQGQKYQVWRSRPLSDYLHDRSYDCWYMRQQVTTGIRKGCLTGTRWERCHATPLAAPLCLPKERLRV